MPNDIKSINRKAMGDFFDREAMKAQWGPVTMQNLHDAKMVTPKLLRLVDRLLAGKSLTNECKQQLKQAYAEVEKVLPKSFNINLDPASVAGDESTWPIG